MWKRFEAQLRDWLQRIWDCSASGNDQILDADPVRGSARCAALATGPIGSTLIGSTGLEPPQSTTSQYQQAPSSREQLGLPSSWTFCSFSSRWWSCWHFKA